VKAQVPFVANISAPEAADWLQALGNAMPEAEFVPFESLSTTKGHKAAVVANPDPNAIKALPDLVWVQSLWAGVEKLLHEPTLGSVGISRLVDPALATTMAEAALAWTLYLHRDMPGYRDQQNKKCWQQLPYVPAAKRRVGILGVGKLGTAAANALVQTGFDVMGWSRQEKNIPGVRCFSGTENLPEMVGQCDILVCLLPLTPATRCLLGEATFTKMPQGAALINFGRGPIVDTAALMQALDNGSLNHAVLDVFDQEPLEENSPLWHHAKITVLPHISAPTTLETAAKIACENLRTYFNTDEMPQLVNRTTGY